MSTVVSVVIPAYNAAATLRATINSVLAQTVAPSQILVFDDGSDDETHGILKSYLPRVTVISGGHVGVATARNILCSRATGEFVAFLDADDLWHPRYLEVQKGLFEKYPAAAAFFTAHIDFHGWQDYEWETDASGPTRETSLLSGLEFFRQFQKSPGSFLLSSFCVPKWVLKDIGEQPFGPPGKGADDWYFTMLVSLRGEAVQSRAQLVAYRITNSSLSSNRIVSCGDAVRVFEQLKSEFSTKQTANYSAAFTRAFASKRRQHAKILFGAGLVADGRKQLRHLLRNSSDPMCFVKSLVLLALTHLPNSLQPKWPASQRQSAPSGS